MYFEIISDLQKYHTGFPYAPPPDFPELDLFHNQGTVIKTKKLTSIQTIQFSPDLTQISPGVPLMFFFWSRIQPGIISLFQPMPAGGASLSGQLFVITDTPARIGGSPQLVPSRPRGVCTLPPRSSRAFLRFSHYPLPCFLESRLQRGLPWLWHLK